MIVYKDSFDGLVVFKSCSKKFDSLQRKGLLIKDILVVHRVEEKRTRKCGSVVYYTARICQSSWGYQVQNKSGGFKEWVLTSKEGQIQGAEVRVQRKRSWEGHYSCCIPIRGELCYQWKMPAEVRTRTVGAVSARASDSKSRTAQGSSYRKTIETTVDCGITR